MFPFIYRSFIDRTGALAFPLPLAVLLRAEELLNLLFVLLLPYPICSLDRLDVIDRTGALAFPERGRTLIAAQYCRYCRQSNFITLTSHCQTFFSGTYTPVDTCCHYQFCFALQMRQSCISLEQKQNLSLN